MPGTHTSKIFTIIGASASLVFAFNTGMLPEIQVKFRKLGLFLVTMVIWKITARKILSELAT